MLKTHPYVNKYNLPNHQSPHTLCPYATWHRVFPLYLDGVYHSLSSMASSIFLASTITTPPPSLSAIKHSQTHLPSFLQNLPGKVTENKDSFR